MTSAGMLLGTAAYMSPEQARGKAVDKRADIWAFGVVLYEMLTGRNPFGGDTVTDVLSSVISSEPDSGALPSECPTVRWVIAVPGEGSAPSPARHWRSPSRTPSRRRRDGSATRG